MRRRAHRVAVRPVRPEVLRDPLVIAARVAAVVVVDTVAAAVVAAADTVVRVRPVMIVHRAHR